MKLIRNISDLPHMDHPITLAMGCFDGVHLGHQKVISTAVEQAKERGGEAWVFTFNPHPAKVLVPEKAPPLISAQTCRLRKLEALGVNGVLEIPFDKTYAHIEPSEFLSNLWKKIPTLSGVVCGTDWSFGYRAAGTFQTLEKLCTEHDITATAVPHVLCDGEKISSTHIRQAIAEGNIQQTEKWLGRPFSLFGTVVEGRKIGRDLGFPTANIDPDNELLPGNGVYAARTLVDGKWIDSAVFIGARETFDCQQHVIESHLLDFNGDLYGQSVEVCLVKKIREVTPFSSKEALIEQIEKDVEQIRKRLATDH